MAFRASIQLFSVSSILSFMGGWPGGFPSARVQRGESATARCASTGNRQAVLPLFLFPLFLLPSIGRG